MPGWSLGLDGDLVEGFRPQGSVSTCNAVFKLLLCRVGQSKSDGGRIVTSLASDFEVPEWGTLVLGAETDLTAKNGPKRTSAAKKRSRGD